MKKIILVLLMLCNVEVQAFKQLPQGSLLQAHFIQHRHLKSMPQSIISQGTMFLYGDKGLLWNTKKPVISLVLINKQGIYQLENGQKTVITDMGGDNILFNVLTGDLSNEVKGFKVVQLKNGRIRLIPTQAEMQQYISAITIAGKDRISQMIIERPNGDYDDIAFQNHIITRDITPQLMAWFDA